MRPGSSVRRRVFNGKPRSPHSGSTQGGDRDSGRGGRSGVVAAGEGLLLLRPDVILDHGGGMFTLLTRTCPGIDVKDGAPVEARQRAGASRARRGA